MGSNANTNMYRIGDYVYFETGSTSPYQVRRIEELSKTPSGNVEAKVMCFFRRRDLPPSLTFLADRHQSVLEEEMGKERDNLSSKHKHLLQHRELFLSRQVETLPATHIRGRCSVTLLNETESLMSYLERDDVFFYSLVYDPQQKTLLADRGEIRVGQRYQADKPRSKLQEGESDERNFEELETLIWTPDHGLTDKQVDQFLVISRSVGTFARALDCSSSVKQPSLHMSAAAASRDVTLFYAMDTLHNYKYNISEAISALVPSTGPLLCRDEMEEWSTSEANLFEEAMEKYGKDFADIRADFLPWKTLKNIIEYYYMWKTTDRYVQQKRVKAAEAESKLKQVYIPPYNKTSPAALPGSKGIMNGCNTQEAGKPCESCLSTSSSQWYAWTSSTGLQARLCNHCWGYWRKYGGLKAPNQLIDAEVELSSIKKVKTGPPSDEMDVATERVPGLFQPKIHRCAVAGCGKEFKMKNQLARHYSASHGYSMRSGSPRPIMKTRTAFYLHTTPMTRVARRICSDILKSCHARRAPFWPVNVMLIKQECQVRVVGKSTDELRNLIKCRKRKLPNAKVSEIAHTLGQDDRVTPNWLILTEKSKLPKPAKEAYPKPPKAPDGSLIYEKVPERHVILPSVSPSLLKKRGYEELNGVDVSASKRMAWDPQAAAQLHSSNSRGNSPISLMSHILPATQLSSRTAINHMNGSKPKIATMTRIGSRKQIISWMDAPDDLYFCSTEFTRKIRKTLSSNEMRRLARSPCKKAANKGGAEMLLGGTTVSAPPSSAVPSLGPILDTKLTRVWRSMSPDQSNRERRYP